MGIFRRMFPPQPCIRWYGQEWISAAAIATGISEPERKLAAFRKVRTRIQDNGIVSPEVFAKFLNHGRYLQHMLYFRELSTAYCGCIVFWSNFAKSSPIYAILIQALRAWAIRASLSAGAVATGRAGLRSGICGTGESAALRMPHDRHRADRQTAIWPIFRNRPARDFRPVLYCCSTGPSRAETSRPRRRPHGHRPTG